MLRVLAGLTLVFCLFAAAGIAQEATGTIAGVVIDGASGDPLIDAGVEVVGQNKKVRTDIDGKFKVKVAPGTYELRIFAPLYQGTRLQNVRVIENQVASVSANLKPEGAKAEQVVEVVAQANKAAEATQLLQRKNAAVVSDNISAQSIQKSPDSDAAEVVQRVPAVTVQDDKFIYVRGLGERYSSALLNGSRLPSTDPNKRVVPLDLFPAEFIESMSVFKSYTPDLPGDFSGGLLDIHLKEFPETLTYSIGATMVANTNSTAHRVDTYDGSDLDYVGFGKDYRSLPDLIPDGRLAPLTTTARQRSVAAEFRNIWTPKRIIAPPNFGTNFSIGNTWGPAGALLGVTYGTEWKHRKNETLQTFQNETGGGESAIRPQDSFLADRTTFETKFGAVLTSGYKIDSNQKLTARALINRLSTDEVLKEFGTKESGGPEARYEQWRLQYREDQLWFAQLGGEHKFSWVELNWRSAYSQTTEDEPDTRDVHYVQPDPSVPLALSVQSPSLQRAYAELDENLTDSALDTTFPFTTRLPFTEIWSGLKAKLKTGVAYSYRDRRFDYRRFQNDIRNYSQTEQFTLLPEQLLIPENYGLGSDGFIELSEDTRASDKFTATQEIAGAYGMLDLPIVRDQLRIIAGVRAEYSYIQIDGADLQSLPVGKIINDLDPLPGVNLVYSPRSDMNVRYGFSQSVSRPEFRELTPTEFSVPGGERTVIGNPDLVSANIQSHDLRWEWFFAANELVSASVFYKLLQDPIETITKSQTSRVADTFKNADEATLIGCELEGRKNFAFAAEWLPAGAWHEALAPHLRNLSLQANYSYIYSDVELPPEQGTENYTNKSRALQGQAPYVVNLALEYDVSGSHSARLLYNTVGRRIAAAGTDGLPDLYDEQRDQLDFVLVKKIAPFGTPLSTKFAVENILNDQFIQTQDGETAKNYTTGVKFSLGVSYSF